MNVLKQAEVGSDTYMVSEIDSFDNEFMSQFWVARTAIWTQKFTECSGDNGIERDMHDDKSVYIVLVVNSQKVVAGCRLIQADTCLDLPIASHISEHASGKSIEISRFFFTSGEIQESLFRLFITGIIFQIRKMECPKVYAKIRAPLFDKLRKMGIQFLRIGPDDHYGQKRFVPAVFES